MEDYLDTPRKVVFFYIVSIIVTAIMVNVMDNFVSGAYDRGIAFSLIWGTFLALSFAYYPTIDYLSTREELKYGDLAEKAKELHARAVQEIRMRKEIEKELKELKHESERTITDWNTIRKEMEESLGNEKRKVASLQGMLKEYQESAKELERKENELEGIQKEIEESQKELERMLESVKERERNVAELEVCRQKYRSLVNSLNRAKSIEAVREKQAQL